MYTPVSTTSPSQGSHLKYLFQQGQLGSQSDYIFHFCRYTVKPPMSAPTVTPVCIIVCDKTTLNLVSCQCIPVDNFNMRCVSRASSERRCGNGQSYGSSRPRDRWIELREPSVEEWIVEQGWINQAANVQEQMLEWQIVSVDSSKTQVDRSDGTKRSVAAGSPMGKIMLIQRDLETLVRKQVFSDVTMCVLSCIGRSASPDGDIQSKHWTQRPSLLP